MVLEHMLEIHHVLVVQRLVDLNLRNQFLSRPFLSQRVLRNYLRSLRFFTLDICYFVAFCETSLAQQLAANVLSNQLLAVRL